MWAANPKMSQSHFGLVDALRYIIKKHYMNRRSSDKMMELIFGCKQGIREPENKFEERLDRLLKELVPAVLDEWPEAPGHNALGKDFKRIAVKRFVKDLRAHPLRARIMDCENEDLTTLIETAENAEELFGGLALKINGVKSELCCSFCSHVGHEWCNCRQ